jgi:hypothetical protein
MGGNRSYGNSSWRRRRRANVVVMRRVSLWKRHNVASQEMMERKRLYYVPGMISLLGLPILILVFAPKTTLRKRVLTISFPYEGPDPYRNLFSKNSFLHSIRAKKQLNVNFTDPAPGQNPDLFSKKLSFVSREIARLQFLNDTTCVLKIQFGENNTYGNFVWMVNQAKIYDLHRFAFIDNCFYLLGNSPPVIDTSSNVISPIEL